MSLIPRFYDTLSGTVKVGGMDVRDYRLESLRDGVSVQTAAQAEDSESAQADPAASGPEAEG